MVIYRRINYELLEVIDRWWDSEVKGIENRKFFKLFIFFNCGFVGVIYDC